MYSTLFPVAYLIHVQAFGASAVSTMSCSLFNYRIFSLLRALEDGSQLMVVTLPFESAHTFNFIASNFSFQLIQFFSDTEIQR
jgi:hypothetical protein